MSEKLSALIDSELDEFERARILRELARDENLCEVWSRYHIIGLAMRREQFAPQSNFAERVAKRLGEETDGAASDRRVSARRSSSGLAVAASVAGVLLLGGLMVKLYTQAQPVAPGASGSSQIAVVDDSTRWEGADPRTEDALNTFLLEHGEFTSASGMNGLTAYTKFVAYDSQ